jgi:hypothetical protein
LTRIAIHILVKKGELLIWRKNGHFPHSGAGIHLALLLLLLDVCSKVFL